MKAYKPLSMISLVLFIVATILLIPAMSLVSICITIEALLLVVGLIYDPISEIILVKKSALKKKTGYILFSILSRVFTVVLIVFAMSSLELLIIVVLLAWLLLGYSALLPLLIARKLKVAIKPTFAEKHPVKISIGLISFNVSLITLLVYMKLSGTIFCFEVASYYGFSATLRIIIFFILLAALIFSTLLLTLGVITKKKEISKKKWILPTSVSLGELLLTVILVFTCLTGSFCFYPTKGRMNDSIYENPQISKIEITSDNNIYTGIYMNNNSSKITLWFPGNGMSAKDGYYEIRHSFEHSNTNLVIVSYPMFGDSKGLLTEKNVYKEADLFYEYITNTLHYEAKDITIAGYSIGTGVANYVASKYEASRLILASPYSNFTDVLNTYVSIYYPPLSCFADFKFPSDQYAKNITCPVTIVATPYDTVVRYKLSEKLAKAYNNEPTFITLKNGGHASTFTSREFLTLLLQYDQAYLDELTKDEEEAGIYD